MGNNKASWSNEETLMLEELYKNGSKAVDMLSYFPNRTKKAIENRIAKLGLYEKYIHLLKYNEFDLSGEYGVGYTSNNDVYYFDLDDYEKISKYSWNYDKKGYLISPFNSGKTRSTIKQHRVIMCCSDSSLQVDHINGIKHDNRKQNLRIVTNQQNHMNKGVSKNNSSGTVGVSFSKHKGKWRAYITLNDKQKSLGYYYKKEDAIKARKEAEILYFGEYRRRNLNE